MTSSTLCDLDVNTLSLVFHYVGLQDRRKLHLVCKAFHTALRSSGLLYETVSIQAPVPPLAPGLSELEALHLQVWAAPRLPHTLHLKVSAADPGPAGRQHSANNAIAEALAACKQLQSLQLDFPGREFQLDEQVKKLSGLTRLSLTASHTLGLGFGQWGGQLQELEMHMDIQAGYGTAHKFLQPFAQLRRLALHDLSSCYSDDLLLGLICAGLPSSSSAQPGAAACSSNVLFRQIRDVAFEHSSRTPLHPRPLQHLKLVSCRLLRPPQGIFLFSRLTSLDLSHNQLIALDLPMGGTSNVQHLNLSHNPFRRLPGGLNAFKQLRQLSLAYTEAMQVHVFMNRSTARAPCREPNTLTLLQLVAKMPHLDLLDLRQHASKDWDNRSQEQFSRLDAELNSHSGRDFSLLLSDRHKLTGRVSRLFQVA